MAYSIIFATAQLRRNGHSFEGCPLIVKNLVPQIPFCRWLMAMAENRASPDTISTYSFAIKGWLTWLDLRKIEWWRVLAEDLTGYRRALQHGRSSSTINVKLAAICSFYLWAYEHGVMPVLPFKMSTARRARGLSVPAIKPDRVLETIPRTHPQDVINAILAANPRQDANLVFRDELICEIALFTGARRMEIAALTVDMILQAKRTGAFYTLMLFQTKGGRPRQIFLPQALWKRLQRYIEVHREAIIERCCALRPTYKPPRTLFLLENGKPIRREYITAMFAAAARAANIDASFHDFRHIFITKLVEAFKRNKISSMRLVQDIAGHASQTTTARYDHSEVIMDTDGQALKILKEATDAANH